MDNLESGQVAYGPFQRGLEPRSSPLTMTTQNECRLVLFGKGWLNVELYANESRLELRLAGTAYTVWSGSEVDFEKWIALRLKRFWAATRTDQRKISAERRKAVKHGHPTSASSSRGTRRKNEATKKTNRKGR